jgi:uncharacterized protein (DUF2141 family)
MSKSLVRIGFAALLATTLSPASANAPILGQDAAACMPGSPDSAVLVRISGFKTRTGGVRVYLFGNNPDDFLAKGKRLRKVDLPVTPAGPMAVCIRAPANGDYAIAVRHDLDGDRHSGWSDGGGFSRNPHLSLFSYKPRLDQVIFRVNGHAAVDVILNYRQGLSIGPIRQN